MSVDEEVHEHIHHAADPWDRRVAGTMAIIAAGIAVVTVLGQHLTAEQLLLQQRSSDQWAFYQAKSIRRFVSEATRDTLTQEKADPAVISQYAKEAQRYASDQEEIQKEARALEVESRLRGRQSLRVHFGEVFLEIAIVFSSLAILTKHKYLFTFGAVAAVLGAAIAITGWFVH